MSDETLTDHIIQEFWRLLDEKAMNQMTVSEIVANLKINRASFYYHFGCIEDVLYPALEHEILRNEELREFLVAFLLGEFGLESLIWETSFERNLSNALRHAEEDCLGSAMSNAAANSWIRATKQSDGLTLEAQAALDFAAAGLVTLVENHALGYPMPLPFINAVGSNLLATLRAGNDRLKSKTDIAQLLLGQTESPMIPYRFPS